MRTNILHGYRSYASHTLIFLCADTQKAEELCTSSESEFLSVAMEKNGMFFGGPQPVLKGAVLFCNTMKDSQPQISKLNWTTYLVPDISASSASTIATDGKLVFNEYKTFDFYRLYNEAVGVLGTDPQSVIWVVKTIFIGFNDSDYGQFIADTRPFMFWLVNSTAKYTSAGGSYIIEFVGLSNGASKNSQLHVQASDNFVIKPENAKTLQRTLAQLAEHYNSAYEVNRAEQIKLNPEYANYKVVKYKILTDNVYAQDKYVVDQWDVADRGMIDVQSGSILVHTSNIENSIHQVMKYCRQVSIDAKMSDSKFQTYKIVSNTEFLQDEVIVTFKVVQYTTPAVTNMMSSSEQTSAAAAVGQDSDHYQFYYLNTGQNVDVINFDIAVNHGLLLMQNLHNSVPLQATITKTDEQSAAMNDGVGKKTTKPILTPSLMGTTPPERNRIFHDQQLTYHQAVAKHAFVEGLESNIKITGNPDLLGRFNTLPSKVISDTPDWATKFILCKIDIAIPTSTDHHGAFTYAQPFWYDGYYAILSVEHIFEGTQFTQELELMSLPEVDRIASKTGQPDE